MAPYEDGPREGMGRDWAQGSGQWGEGEWRGNRRGWGDTWWGPRGEVGDGLGKGVRGPMGERGAVTIIRTGRCNERGPFGAPMATWISGWI